MQTLKRWYHFLLAWGSNWLYGRPSHRLVVVGVTGTKGKSTTCRYIASVLEAGGFKVGLLSTVEFQIGSKRWSNDKKMTMLGRGQVHKMLKEMVAAGCEYAVIETSSEGILQFRHIGIEYDIAVFTNLGTEHQERHGGFENLKRDKGKLFAAISKHHPKVLKGKTIPRCIVVNADDIHAPYYAHFDADSKYSFGISSAVGLPHTTFIHGVITNVASDGSSFTVQDALYHLSIVGEFNVYNALAAVAVGTSQGLAPADMARGIESVSLVAGRMEFIDAGQPFKVVVDYAHEPLGLTALFSTLRQLVSEQHGKVIGVIGSDGGGRDVQKRPRMGAISGKLCDYVVVTDVNCYDDDPNEIAEMLASGAREAGKKDGMDLFVDIDRRAAIKKAFDLAKKGDVVAITAKGTEPWIAVAHGHKIPWDDRRIARELLENL